ncbi:MAG: SMP-30/gluconolactonase/LRE family protein [Aquabacterium sp.]
MGEGVCWDAARRAVLFVDIHGKRVLAFDAVSGRLRTWHSPERIGWLIPRQAGAGFLAGLQSGFALVELKDDVTDLHPQWVARPFGEDSPLRLNDAKADAKGRVSAGSLNNADESRPDGVLFRLEPGGKVETVDEKATAWPIARPSALKDSSCIPTAPAAPSTHSISIPNTAACPASACGAASRRMKAIRMA